MQNKDFDLNMHTARLLMTEPFFAAISRRINKRASNGVPTAGVMVNKDTAQFEMLYNPEFFSGLSDNERRAVLMHEFYHVIFKHVTERAPWVTGDKTTSTKVWNIATDLAINSHIDNLPEGGLIPGEGPFVDLPKGMAAEWYVDKVKDMFEKQKQQNQEGETDGQGSSNQDSGGNNCIDNVKPLDDHSGWEQTDQETKEVANERLKDIIKQAADDAAKSNSWGSVSNDVKRKVIESLKSKVDWRKVLRYFVKSSQRADKTSSVRRINRRYPYIHAGKKSSRVANIAVSIDQSGSVCDRMLSMFFSELNKLSSIASFTVIPFDTKVDESKIYEWKRGENRKVERVLRGGTCFDAPTEYVNSKNFDGHIVLTDMEAPKPKRSKCQRMWMTTADCAARKYFSTNERVIEMEAIA